MSQKYGFSSSQEGQETMLSRLQGDILELFRVDREGVVFSMSPQHLRRDLLRNPTLNVKPKPFYSPNSINARGMVALALESYTLEARTRKNEFHDSLAYIRDTHTIFIIFKH